MQFRDSMYFHLLVFFKNMFCKREWDRERQRERERDRDRQKDRETERETEKDRESETLVFVTFNFLISRDLTENLIEISQVVFETQIHIHTQIRKTFILVLATNDFP